jgi:PAS domain S-box-containing protein
MNVPESMLRHVPAPGATDEDPAQLILQAMTEGVSLSTEDGIIVYANPAEEAMFGYGPGELIGCHVSVQNAYPRKRISA